LRWRYFDSPSIDASSSNPQLSGNFNAVDAKIGRRNYIDVFAQWNINKSFNLRGGVNNVFDPDPPIISSTIAVPPFDNINIYPKVYDALDRNFFINVQAKL
jgi:iron complex outermembrane receptor protein